MSHRLVRRLAAGGLVAASVSAVVAAVPAHATLPGAFGDVSYNIGTTTYVSNTDGMCS